MQVANESTILGDFDDATFTHFGVTSSFYRRDGKFFTRTEGPDGERYDYEIAYTFGVEPLQQYLIAFPGGRYQALSIAWDSRPAERGGQRWFHLHPGEPIGPDDPLHWTGPNYNWNFMCAECHSSHLEKNYLLEEDRYETSRSEIDVSCEACHGPGSNHVGWAESAETANLDAAAMGLVVDLSNRPVSWEIDPETGLATRNPPRTSSAEVEACGRCHARRSVIAGEYLYGRPLTDTHRPALLEEDLYHADGQILDEVYVYGSFLQSEMYRQGVTCSDCHEPHGLRLYNSGNALCNRCHLAAKFDSPEHHFHEPASAAAQCLSCHMPAQTYMVVDPRRDHSFRIPRPALSVKLDTPNACNGCHADQSTQWAAGAVVQWYGAEGANDPHYGEALHAGRNGLVGAENLLVQLAEDPSQPAIARATALSLLRRYVTPNSVPTLQRALDHGDPLIRAAAVSAFEAVEPRARLRPVYPLLRDRVRDVRLQAARVLASVPTELMSPQQRSALDRALEEYRATQLANADRPEAHLNLGWLQARRGELRQAESAYRTAVGMAPANGDAHHALGLLLVRDDRLSEAVEALGRAAELRPDQARYSYVYGVALQSAGDLDGALKVLQQAHQRHPTDRDLLLGLTSFSREAGDLDSAIEYAGRLVELAPQDQQATQLLAELQVQRR